MTYQKIHDIVEQAKNKHMSGKLVKYNKYKHENIAWLTNGLLRSIQFRDKLYKHLKSTNPTSLEYANSQINLRTYNRILRKSLRAAKRIFYSLIFDKYKADIKNTWKTINGLLSRNCQTKLGPTSLTINGLEITNKLEIVNTFNNVFTNIGANLAKRINYTGDKTFRDYLEEKTNNSFALTDVDENYVISIINNLQAKNRAVDGIQFPLNYSNKSCRESANH